MSDFKALESGGDDSSLPPQTFANHALDYHEFGFAVIPCEGKTPKVSWKKYQTKRPSLATIYRWIKLFPAANIGLITGKISGITVIDCDNPNLSIAELEKEFGESKFIVATPSGGKHLYFQFNGERSKIGFRDKFDLKAEGGFVIAANSFSKKKNGFYKIVKGKLDDLYNLTPLNEAIREEIAGFSKGSGEHSARVRARGIVSNLSIVNNAEPKIPEGQRNIYLFDRLRAEAKNHSNYQSLEDTAFEINTLCFEKSLEAGEVRGVAKSVWRLKEEGRLIIKGEGYLMVKYEAEVAKLIKEPRALALFLVLKYHHQKIKKSFCIAQDAMSKKLGWSKKSLVRAIKVLMEEKFIFLHERKNEKRCKNNKIKTPAHQYSFYLG